MKGVATKVGPTKLGTKKSRNSDSG